MVGSSYIVQVALQPLLIGSALVSIKAITLRRARLILGWVTASLGKPSWYGL